MDSDLEPIHDLVMQATRPEEVFREMSVVLPPRLLEEHLRSEMDVLHKILYPDAYSASDDRDAAQHARERLDGFYAEALRKSGQGIYNIDGYQAWPLEESSRMLNIRGRKYVIGSKRHIGERATLYDGRVAIDGGSGGVVIRVAHSADDNPYLFNEIRMLELLHRQDVGYWRNLPYMLDRFMAGDRVGIICRLFEGYSLVQVRESPLHKDGLDQRHMVWILDRMLGLLGYVHKLGIVHGAIDPERIRVRPSNHNALLSGWGRAVYKPATTGERVIPKGGMFEAPEVGESGIVGPWTDIYGLGKTLIWLLGGDLVANEFPDGVEPKIQQFLLNMVRKNPRARPRDAWQLYKAQNRLKDSLWRRQFRHLDM